MFERTDLQFLQDIPESARAAMEFVAGYDLERFSGDRKTKAATIRELEIVGEAANRISTPWKDKYADVPWRLMNDLRNVLSHEYSGVNDQIVWDIVQNKIPELASRVEEIIRIKLSLNDRVL